MWNLFNKEEKEDRSHQDNCYGRNVSSDGWDNGSYQYCPYCCKHRRFIFDRCDVCKNN